MIDYLEIARRATAGLQPAAPAPLATHLLETCRRCGGNRLRLQAGLWVCQQCFPETPGGPEPILDAEANRVVRVAALDLLNQGAVRIIETGQPERFTIGIWRDQDSRELREALRVLGLDRYLIVYLDDPAVPERYRAHQPQRPQPALFGGDQ